jgi:hypothetical protein
MKTLLTISIFLFSLGNIYSNNLDSIPLINNSNIESKIYYTEANKGYAIEDMHLKLDSTNLDSNKFVFITIEKISFDNSKLNYYKKYRKDVKYLQFDSKNNFIFTGNLPDNERYLIKGYIEYTIEIYNGELENTIIHKSKIYVN